MNEDSITRIYCDVDDFCKVLEGYCRAHLSSGGGVYRHQFYRLT
jgi:hypothetical protein